MSINQSVFLTIMTTVQKDLTLIPIYGKDEFWKPRSEWRSHPCLRCSRGGRSGVGVDGGKEIHLRNVKGSCRGVRRKAWKQVRY